MWRAARATWGARPDSYSRVIWGLILALRPLPWPWGEDLLAAIFAARGALPGRRGRQARRWAAAQPAGVRSPRVLACALCAFHGRFVARSAFLGIRGAEAGRRLVAVGGVASLTSSERGMILLGFHLGPPNAYVALRTAGLRLTWIGGRGASGAWAPELRARYQSRREAAFFGSDPGRWVQRLHRARQLLHAGEHVFINADGDGREAATIALPGGPLTLRAGWLALRRATGAPVVPVLSRLEGRTHVVTVHPPLPEPLADGAADLEACRGALAGILTDYVRRFPEQCYSLAFPAAGQASRGDALGPGTSTR